MTPEEASKLRWFSNTCNCGGYGAGSTNDRNPRSPHMTWCAQYKEFKEWRAAMDIYEQQAAKAQDGGQ